MNLGCRILKGNTFLLTLNRFSTDLSHALKETNVTSSTLARNLPFLNKYESPRKAWVESLETQEEVKKSMVDLHPDVFGAMPRIDVIADNVKWQKTYRKVSFLHSKVTFECRGGGRKPWPQKGLGRARHGSIRSPLFKNGGIAHGPRSPTSFFYMLPFFTRVHGLTSTLSVKLAQDDLHIVDTLELPTDDPKYLEELVQTRNWGVSVLFVDDTDEMPRNITVATDNIRHMNLMPVYGLNVYSMLRHETLVLTLAAVERIEERILYQFHRPDYKEKNLKFRPNNMFKGNKEQALSQEQVRKVLKKIQTDDETISKLYESLLQFQRRSSKIRDAYDHISKCVYESSNGMNSAKEQLLNLAMNFAQVGDSEDDAIIELDNVLGPFSLFKNHSQTLKSEINHIYESSKEFDRIQMPAKSQKWIEDRAEAFETKKLSDFKNVLSHFIKTELAFHVEAVEIYSSAYKEILKINIENSSIKGSVEKLTVGTNLATFLKTSPQLEEGKNSEKSETEESSETEYSESESQTENSNFQMKSQ